jgi:hypothetical protein
MANETCLLTSSYDGVDCPKPTPGARRVVYFANLSETTTWTAGATGIYTNFTLASGASLYSFETSKDTLVGSEALVGALEDQGAYDQDVALMLKSMSIGSRNAVNDLNGTDLVAFVPTKQGEVLIIGKDFGCRMIENTASTATDAYGETVLLRATQMKEKRFHLDAGGIDATLALLESKIIAS